MRGGMLGSGRGDKHPCTCCPLTRASSSLKSPSRNSKQHLGRRDQGKVQQSKFTGELEGVTNPPTNANKSPRTPPHPQTCTE